MNKEKVNRKKQNREIERKNRNHRRLLLGTTFAFLALILLAIVWVAWDTQNRRWVMTFEGTRISVNDLRFYESAFQQNLSVPASREFLTDTLIEALTVLHHAELSGITLTNEEQDEMLSNAMGQRMMTNFDAISDERAAEFFSVHAFLVERLLEAHVPMPVAEPGEFAEAFAEAIDDAAEHRDFLYDTVVRHIAITDDADLERVAAGISTPEFYNLFEEFAWEHEGITSEELGFEANLTAMELASLLATHFLLTEENMLELLAMVEGQTGVFTMHDSIIIENMTFVIYIESRTMNYEELEYNFIQNQLVLRREETFFELLESWIEAADVQLNTRALNRL